jgi:hypothetical protein
LAASGCLGAYFPAFAFNKELAQAGANNIMVIRNQYPHNRLRRSL